MGKPFTYNEIVAPLRFRILNLHGSLRRDSTLEFTLHERTLADTEPEYECISYCWDDQKPDQVALCDGREILVTKNCQSALRRFRPANDSERRTLWIDAVCICQTATKERSQQVKLMGAIYMKATHVLVWLGDMGLQPVEGSAGQPDVCASRFEWLSRLAECARERDVDQRRDMVLRLALDHCHSDLIEFTVSIPWFKRLWVVQECVLGQRATLFYGEAQASFNGILEAKSILEHYQTLGHPDAATAASGLWNALASHQLGLKLWKSHHSAIQVDEVALCNFLAEIRFSKASDSKDKILGLYKILTDIGVALPEPDYAKSTATIYREATIAVIKATKSLRVLEQVDGLGPTAEMTSWVPDWSSSKHAIGLGTAWGCPEKALSAPMYEFVDDGRCLRLKATLVDVITERSTLAYMHVDERIGDPPDYHRWTRNPPLPDSRFRDTMERHPHLSTAILTIWNFRVLRDFVNVALQGTSLGANNERMHALYRCLMSHPRRGEDAAAANEHMALSWFQTLSEHVSLAQRFDELEDWKINHIALRKWLDAPELVALRETQEFHALLRIMRAKEFDVFHGPVGRLRYNTIFTTANGKIGIAPWPIQAGDEIAFVWGMRFPVVLRLSGEHYKLIAHAYVDGSMHGCVSFEDASKLRVIDLV